MSYKKIKTFGDAIKRVKKLWSTLGIGYWFVYMTETRYYDYSTHHSENSEIEAYPGMMFKVNTCLIVSDPIELFIDKEDFLFVI